MGHLVHTPVFIRCGMIGYMLEVYVRGKPTWVILCTPLCYSKIS